MTKRGFTLIELIFVIVIIGMLAATAIPKYKNLKANAEVNNVAKIISDVTSGVASAFYNAVNLENANENTIKLNKLVEIKGDKWKFEDSLNAYTLYINETIYKIRIALNNSEKRLEITAYCNNFGSTAAQTKCKKLFHASTPNSTLDQNGFLYYVDF